MMEARLSQHICFKTATKESRSHRLKDTIQQNPVFKVSSAKENLITNNAYSPDITSPMSGGLGKSFLFLPKNDNRNRLTSTPNQELPQITPELRHDGSNRAAFDFSPLGSCSHDRLKSFSCENDTKNMDDIKGILFPKFQTTMSSFDNMGKRKRSSNSEESSPTFDQRSKSISCYSKETSMDISEPIFAGHFEKNLLKDSCLASPRSPMKRRSLNFENSLQDSGIDSLANSLCIEASIPTQSANFENDGSLSHSPLKRRADDDRATISVESPMKRLAFMSLDNSQMNTKTADDSGVQLNSLFEINNIFEEPGSLFLKTSPTKSTLNIIPPPIFPNAIQLDFSTSPEKDRNAFSTQTFRTGHKISDDFEFTKPFVPKKKNLEMKRQTITTIDPVMESKIRIQYLDIIGELSRRNLQHIIGKIFTHIRQKDILRCSHVSQSWSNICEGNKFLQRQIKSLKKRFKTEENTRGSENITAKKSVENALLKSPAKLGSKRNLTTGRTALSSLQTRVRQSPLEPVLMPTTPSGKNHFVRTDSKFEHNQGVKRTLQFEESLMPCPKCSWTAKIYADGNNKAQCYRAECRYRFCVGCKSDYHWPNPCSLRILTSPMKQTKSIKAGTKKSKARLKKRLMM